MSFSQSIIVFANKYEEVTRELNVLAPLVLSTTFIGPVTGVYIYSRQGVRVSGCQGCQGNKVKEVFREFVAEKSRNLEI